MVISFVLLNPLGPEDIAITGIPTLNSNFPTAFFLQAALLELLIQN